MSATDRRQSTMPGDLGGYAIAGVALLYIAICVAVTAGQHAGALLTDPPVADSPFMVAPVQLVTGELQLSTTAWIVAGLVMALVLGFVALTLVWWRGARGPANDIDRAARYMGRKADVARLTAPEVSKASRRMGLPADVVGLPLGRTVYDRCDLYLDFESSAVGLAGARVGKTTSIVIPWIMAAPGACVVTSNRRDVVDGTRSARPGYKWVFDPQEIVGEEPSFFVDFLQDFVLAGPQRPEVKAQTLAGIFATATAPPDSRADRFFDPKGQTLLGHFLHAAAISGVPLTKVYEWVTDEKEQAPYLILRDNGFPLSAKAVKAVMDSPDKQRGGIYATAELCVTWLTYSSVVPWITPGPGRARFSPAEFAASTDTIYLLSKEGRGTLSALTTALTAAICEAAEHLASRSSGGRLPVPMTCVLDEVANCCRWPDLPDVYSHYGGRGIILISILQSWSQGVGVWGERALTAMWSAASVNLFLGGVREVKLLHDMRELIGTYRRPQTSVTSSRGSRSSNVSEMQEQILATSDLGSFPRGRALLFASGVRPTLVRTLPWWESKHAEAIKASIAANEPYGTPVSGADRPMTVEQEAKEWDVEPAGARWKR